MKKSNLSAMSLKQLLALQADLIPLIEARRQEEHAALRAKLAKMAEDAGFRLDAVLNDSRRKAAAVPVKYRDPAHPENTWSGRGRPARWVTAYLKQGRKLESFRVA